jgi:alpha-ketoglutarate-dependent taurine dioxygenase
MSPLNDEARAVIQLAAVAVGESVRIDWSDGREKVLLLDNRACLHAREAVPEGETDRVMLRTSYQAKVGA